MDYASTILIVDDQLSVREVLRGVLAKQNYNLVFAASGEEALVKAQEFTPDLILLDVMMPGITGFEVCRRVRADSLLAEVPIILITALDDHESVLDGLNAGADDFISKPFNHAELRARVQTTLRLNRYRRLLSRQTKFEWVVEHASDGYIVLAANDNILYANPQARFYLDLPQADEQVAGPFLELAGKYYAFEPEQAWQGWPENPPTPEQLPRYLVRPESASTNTFWLLVNSYKLPASSEGDWIIQLQNVTAQMSLQRHVWEFQSLVSHKLRTPLFGIIGGLEYLQKHLTDEQLNSDIGHLFELVHQNTQRLERDIQDILKYITAPSLVQPQVKFSLSQLDNVISQISTHLGLDAVVISNEVTPEDAVVSFSAQAIELILQEILENAKKFHPQQNPTIEISLQSLSNNKQISLKISDNGLTLSPEQLAQVWTPYYQGEKYFTGQTAGMGLGLSVVALLVWSGGGACRMYNRDNQPGVTVELTIPIYNS
jgi:CheY-like chemotaxis protein